MERRRQDESCYSMTKSCRIIELKQPDFPGDTLDTSDTWKELLSCPQLSNCPCVEGLNKKTSFQQSNPNPEANVAGSTLSIPLLLDFQAGLIQKGLKRLKDTDMAMVPNL